MGDIRFEKFVEVLYDQLFAALPANVRRDCPALRCLADVLSDIKEANNDEIAVELGMLPRCDFECPCGKVKKEH